MSHSRRGAAPHSQLSLVGAAVLNAVQWEHDRRTFASQAHAKAVSSSADAAQLVHRVSGRRKLRAGAAATAAELQAVSSRRRAPHAVVLGRLWRGRGATWF